jgi:hypothetical protein
MAIEAITDAMTNGRADFESGDIVMGKADLRKIAAKKLVLCASRHRAQTPARKPKGEIMNVPRAPRFAPNI